MEEIKLIFLDIDGTLITDKKEITEKTKRVIGELWNDRNIHIVLISARLPKSLEFICDKLEVPHNYIAFNGSIINLEFAPKSISPNSPKIKLSTEVIETVINSIQDWGNISFNLYTKDEWLCSNLNYSTKREARNTYVNPDQVGLSKENLKDMIEGKDVLKILIRQDEDGLAQVYQELYRRNIHEKTFMLSPKPALIEITPFGISKGLAIDEIAKITGINHTEMMAFGDARNDLEMIKKVKYGYAMGNASDELKAVAYAITGSNNEEGVANALVDKFYK